MKGSPMPGIQTSSLKDIQLQPQEDGGGSKTEYADIFSSDDGTPSPIVLGVFTLEHSDKPLLFDYGFDEAKYVIEGEVALTDLDSGETRNLVAGDVIHISTGTRTKWTTESRVKVLYVAGRGYDLADDIARMREASESHAPSSVTG
jgi:ethanolamine utilization protein EutQ